MVAPSSPLRSARAWVRAHSWLVVIGASLAAVFAVFAVGAAFDDADLGNLGEWVSGVGTVTALGVSLYLLRQGQAERERDVAERERRQARLVTHWVGIKEFDGPQYTLADPPTGPCLYIKNGSQEAVYDVVVYPEPLDPEGGAPFGLVGVIPPGETREAFWPFWPDRPFEVRPRIAFIDANGVAWQRDAFRLTVVSRKPDKISLFGMDLVHPPAPMYRPEGLPPD